MYDTFHGHIEEKHHGEAIRTLAPVMAHFHVSENDRGEPGSGQVRFDEAFGALREVGYDDWITIEAFGSALPDLAAATRVWRAAVRARVRCLQRRARPDPARHGLTSSAMGPPVRRAPA